MADSSATHTAIDSEEQPILESILRIRDNLQLLKEDKSTYVKSQDVLALYDQVIEQVNLLNVIREEHGKPLEQNRGPLLMLQMGMISRSSPINVLFQWTRFWKTVFNLYRCFSLPSDATMKLLQCQFASKRISFPRLTPAFFLP